MQNFLEPILYEEYDLTRFFALHAFTRLLSMACFMKQPPSDPWKTHPGVGVTYGYRLAEMFKFKI